LDILVNNAGTNRPEHFTKVKKQDMDYVVDLNIKAAFNIAQSAVKTMLLSKKSSLCMSIQIGVRDGKERDFCV